MAPKITITRHRGLITKVKKLDLSLRLKQLKVTPGLGAQKANRLSSDASARVPVFPVK